jgi:hypothetical protein
MTSGASGWLRLSDDDNVVVLTHGVKAGAELAGPSGDLWLMAVDLSAGHKLASQPIDAGELVVKFGFPIGVATRPIAPGEHVHTHNLTSRHIPAEAEATA